MIDKEKVKNLIYQLLEEIGEDPKREGLCETPQRVADMYCEIFSGMELSPNNVLKKFYEPSQNGEIISIMDIPLYSVCEHHLLPFIGKAHIIYIPQNGIISGLSKFSRIVDCFARRPQVQERLTNQIADFIYSELQPYGVGVMLEAEHLCMTMRGVKASGSKTHTFALRGTIKDNIQMRSEVMNIFLKGG